MKLFQEFVFETDDLEAFEKVLETFVSLIFTSNKKPKLLTKSDLFDDGSSRFGYDPSFDHGQPDVVQVGKKYHFLTDGRTRGAARLYSLGEEFNSEDEALEAGRKLRVECPPKRKWVTTLFENEPSWSFHAEKEKTHITAASKTDVVKRTIEMLKNADLRQFLKDYEADENFDGSHVGYRMAMSYHNGRESIDISLVHIYFGK